VGDAAWLRPIRQGNGKSVASRPAMVDSRAVTLIVLAGTAYCCASSPLKSGPEISKIHSNLIRAVTCAGFAYFVDIGRMPSAIGMIRVETVVRDGYDQQAVTVDIDTV